MKELELEFQGRGEVRGYTFTQIVFTGKNYLYEVSSEESDVKHYEVFRRKENIRFNQVSYPGSNSFGLWAWTYNSEEDAYQKLGLLEIDSETIQELDYEQEDQEEDDDSYLESQD